MIMAIIFDRKMGDEFTVTENYIETNLDKPPLSK